MQLAENEDLWQNMMTLAADITGSQPGPFVLLFNCAVSSYIVKDHILPVPLPSKLTPTCDAHGPTKLPLGTFFNFTKT